MLLIRLGAIVPRNFILCNHMGSQSHHATLNYIACQSSPIGWQLISVPYKKNVAIICYIDF